MPTEGKRDGYDLAKCIKWREGELQERQAGGERSKLIAAQVKRIELDIRERERGLIDIDLHMRALNEIGVIVASYLDALGARIAFEAVGQSDVGTIQGLVLRETRAIRDAIAAAIDRSADESGPEAAGEDNTLSSEQDSGPVGGRKQNPSSRRSGTRKVAQ